MATKSGAYGANDTAVAELSGAYSASDKPADAPPAGKLRRAADTGLALGRGIVAVPETAVGISDLITGGRTGKAVERLGVRFKDAKQVLTDFQSDDQKAADARVQQADGFLPTVGAMIENPSTIANAVAESAPSMLAGGAVSRGLVNKGVNGITAGAVGEGVVSAGQAAEQVRQEGPTGFLTPKQAALAATSGAATGVINRASGKLADKLGIGDVNTAMATGKLGGTTERGIAQRTAYGAINEGVLQELPQSMQEQALQNLALDKPVGKRVAEAGAAGMLVGNLTGAAFGAVSREPQVPAGVDSPDVGAVNPPVAAPGVVPSVQGGGIAPPQAPPKPPAAPPAPSPSKAQAMGINPAAGPLSAGAAIAVDTGADVITQTQEVEKQKAEAKAKEKAKPGADGKKPEPEAPPPVQPVTPDPTAPITGPFTQAIHGASNVTPPPAPAVDPQGPAATQGAGTAADAPAAPGVGADQGPTGASPVPAAVPEPAQAVTPVAPPPTQESTNATQQSRPGETIDPETGEITQSGAQGAGSDGGQRPADALQPGADAKGPQPAPGQPTAPAPASTPPEGKPASTAESVAARERKDRWLKNVADAHRLAGSTGVQIGGVVNGRVNFLGNPNATKQGRALQGSVEEAINAGATPQEIVDAAKKPAAPAQPKPPAPTTPVDMGAHTAATSPLNDRPEPTQAQKEAGNAKLGHIVMSGLGLSIENPEGSTRRSKPDSPVKWETTMKGGHYGYVKGSIGMDGDHVDTFIKPGTPLDFSGTVFVVDQVDPTTGKPDEHKVMIGYQNGMAARQAYQGNYQPGWKGLKAITPMTWDEFKRWVKSEGTKAPLAAGKSDPDAPAATPQSAPTSALSPDTTSSAAAPAGPAPAQTQASAPSKTESVSPAATGPSPDGTPATRDRQGLTEEDRQRAKLDSAAQDLASQIYGDFEEDAFDADEVAPGLRIFAQGAGVPADELRQAVLKNLRASDMSKSRLRKVQKALDPTRVPRTPSKPTGGKNLRAAAYEKNPLLTFLAQHGLFHDKDKPGSQKAEFSPDKQVMGYGPVFRKTGMKPDLLTELAIEDGYLPPDADESQMVDLIRRAIGGERIAPMFTEGAAETEMQKRMQAIDDLRELEDNEVSGPDPDIFAKSNASTEDAMRALGFTDQEIHDATAQGPRAPQEGRQGRGEPDEAQAAGPGEGAQGGPRAPPAEGEPEGLTAPTRADVLRQQAQAEAEAQRKADGGDKPAPAKPITGDVPDMFNTQGSVFDQPAAQEIVEAAVGKAAPLESESTAQPDDAARAKEDLKSAVADLGSILSKNTRATLVPEQEQKIMPTLVRLFDAAARMGYQAFKDAVKYVVQRLRFALGPKVADQISQEELEAAHGQTMFARSDAAAENQPATEGRQYKLDTVREDRATGSRATLSADEVAAINRDAAGLALDKARTAALIEEAKAVKKRFPVKEGWAPIEVSGIASKKDDDGNIKVDKKGNLKISVAWKPISYGFNVPPGKDRAGAKMDMELVGKVANQFTRLVDQIYARAADGDKNAQVIVGHQTWYRNVAAILRQEFGAQGDLFADLLGATSPNTPVDTNWRFAIEVLTRFTKGEFDAEMQAFNAYIEQGGTPSKFPGQKIRQASGKLYGMNSKNSMLALANLWRSVEAGTAPKARNFALNLIGQSNMATIDVWAARMLRRAAGSVRGMNLPRIPTVAEQGVTGTWNAGVTGVTGEFGFGAAVLDKVSADLAKKGIDLSPPDLQALAWFAEKELWTEKNWTSVQGEGGSFEENIESTPTSRYLMGFSVQQGDAQPEETAVTTAQARLLAQLRGDDTVISARVLPTYGMFMGKPEEALDLEWTVKKGQHNTALVMAEAAAIAKERTQMAIFVSRVLAPDEGHPNARPGAEVYFKKDIDMARVKAVMDSFTTRGLDGFTLAVDPRAKASARPGQEFLGLRIQYVPEFDDVTPETVDAVMAERMDQLDDAVRELRLNGDVAFAATYQYDTEVVSGENYDEYIDRGVAGQDSQAGGQARAERSVRERLERAASRIQSDEGTNSAGGVPDAGGATALDRAPPTGELTDEASAPGGETLLGRSDQTQTPEFKKWFGDSNMVNPDGTPMVLYHGTNTKFTEFRRSKTGAMGAAVYLGDDRSVAESYDGDGKGKQVIMEVYARGKYLTNMQWTDYINKHGWSGAEAAAKADGWSGVYDTKFENAVAVWDPADIKSATKNNGDFDPANPDIRFGRNNQAGRGVHIDDANAVVAAVREALPTAPTIHIMESVAQAPADLRKFIRAAGAENDVDAAYHQGEIYVFPANIPSIERMQFVLAHHEIRHHGLGAMLGPRKNQVLFSIHATNANVRTAAAEQIRRGYATSKVLATEEALADMPVDELVKLRGWDKIVAAVREWLRGAATRLRRAGLGNIADAIEPSAWTDKDVAALVARAEGVSRGGSAKYATEGTVFGQDGDMPAFYSALTREINANTARAQPALGWASTMHGLVKAGKIKREELEWSGVLDWLKLQGGKVTREQLVQFLESNGVRVEETVLGGGNKPPGYDADIELLSDNGLTLERNPEDPSMVAFMDENGELLSADELAEEPGLAKELVLAAYRVQEAADADKVPTRYANYQLPGGTNYREVLLTLPAKTETERIETGRGPHEARTPDDGKTWFVVDRSGEWGEASYPTKAAAEAAFPARTFRDAEKLVGPDYKSPHWDMHNVLAHIRVNDRTDADGKRVLFVEEIQSDWAQAGAKKTGRKLPDGTDERVGFATQDNAAVQRALQGVIDMVKRNDNLGFDTVGEAVEVLRMDGPDNFDLSDRDNAIVAHWWQQMGGAGRPQPAPFVTKTDAWLSLALKRIVKMAVDEGYDRVAFVNGDQSAARYDLSKQVDSLEWLTRPTGAKMVSIAIGSQPVQLIVSEDGKVVAAKGRGLEQADGKMLDEVLGKDAASQIMAGDKGQLSDLKVGGEGMKAFYDRIVPNTLKDVLRRVGGGGLATASIPVEMNGVKAAGQVRPEQVGEGRWVLIGPDNQRANMMTYASRAEAMEDADTSQSSGTVLAQMAFDITPAMRSKVAGGLPLFARGDKITEFNSDGPAKEFERYKRLVDQVGQEYTAKGSTMTFEEFTAKVKPLQDKMWEAHFKLEKWKAGRPATSTEEVFPGFQEIPIGTRILATHGLKYPEPTMGTVVGRRGLRMGEKAYVLPEVDFGDGDGRAVLPGDIKEVFAGPRTMFARGGLDSVTDKINTTTKTAGNTAAHYRGLGLQALGRRQITEIYGGILPQLPTYNTLMAQMDADKNEAGAEADQIAQDWGKLKDERQLAELMHDATLAQMDPEKPLLRGDDPLTYDRLRDQFVALSPEARKVYVDARETYRTHHENVRQAIRDRIERSELRGQRKAELLQQMDDEFYKAIKGVYFPLARFGDYVVIVRDGTGKAVSVSRAETINEAEALQRSLRQAYPDMTVGKVLKSKEFNAGRDAVGRGFMQNLYEVLGKQDMDEMQRAEMEDMLGQLYLSALPDLSWAKHGIHRKGTPGFSQDARRAFAQNTFHGARYLAKVRYSDLLENELSDAQKQVDGMTDSESFDSVKAQQVIDEMVKRHDAAMNPAGNSLSTALTSLGFVFHLGLSPASAVVNLTQTALVAYPIMGAKWGFDKAAAALLKASQQAAANKNDISAALSPDEKRAYDEAVRSGVIDVTMAHDLAGISQGEDAKVSWKLRPVMRWASFLFHHAEKFNRQATFVAAYRLAREAGSNPVQAYDQAVKATYDGHFDYSNTNRPRIMQGNAAKVILLFKQYGQNMVYTLARQAYLSMKGKNQFERAQARKALGGLLAMHAAAAGVLGLPMVSTLLAAASMLGGDDDEPWDAEVALRNMLADALGDQAADVLARGLSRLTPWDISGRVGLDKLILPDIQEGLEGQDLANSAMAAALGPVAGIGISMLKGLHEISGGNWARGLEAMTPSVARGPLKALRYGTEGAIDKTGKPIVEDVNDFGIVGQALGFSPSDVRLATEAKSAVHQADARLAKRRATLMRHYAMAMIAGDEEGAADAREDILAFNERNPQRRINPLQMARSVATRRKQIAESKGGVYLPKTHRDAMEAGQFGMP